MIRFDRRLEQYTWHTQILPTAQTLFAKHPIFVEATSCVRCGTVFVGGPSYLHEGRRDVVSLSALSSLKAPRVSKTVVTPESQTASSCCRLFAEVNPTYFLILPTAACACSQIGRLSEEHRQGTPLDGNVYVANAYHQAPHHYLRVRGHRSISPKMPRLLWSGG